MAVVIRAPSPQQPPLEFSFSQANESLWATLAVVPGRPHSFSPELLSAVERALDGLEGERWHWVDGQMRVPIRCAVMVSNHPGYFSAGGDLSFFRECIEGRAAERLRTYSLRCLDIVYRWAVAGSEVDTVSVVQGRALGGGFEAVLASNYVIAEDHSELGFPEILFGLFPVSGGMALLARRVGVHRAEKIMQEGRLYSARELLDMGLVDEICARGNGREAARDYIQRRRSSPRARLMMRRAKARMEPLDFEELRRVVDEWVDTAMLLTPRELRVMDALIGMQKKEFS